jgi:hypothetical protein
MEMIEALGRASPAEIPKVLALYDSEFIGPY